MNSEFLFGNRYRPEALIGRGGMANVYVATDTRLRRRVAIKTLRPEVAVDADSRKRFQREAHSVSAMGHPNIVRVYDAGEQIIPDVSAETPIPFIVMEYIDGKILRRLMDAGAFEPKVAVHIALGILDALDESHRSGIIHRDIKPGNVMITQSGLVKVCDFGIAQAVEDPTNDPSAIVGTAQYFSPEQAKGDIIDGRSDLYSTAVVL
ncbi:MAG: Stk1 family Ser/Thr kinase, partial [Actinomycetota bacterium]